LLALSEAIESRDPYTHGHSARVAEIAYELGSRLGCDERELALLLLGGALHDVGKLTVSDDVLNKPGPLTREEFAQIRGHPQAGARMVVLDSDLRPALPSILFHHERWDGRGYPTGRARTEIPLEPRILAVADCFDAMTSDRPYRAALAPQEAAVEVERCAGSQFDPDVAAVFLEAWDAGAFAAAAPAVRALAS
jgi:HD-GYP domain-containing protein (c-di-GMP phosphodiesterase class II)